MAMAICFMKKTGLTAKAREDDGDHQRGGADDPAGAGNALRDGVLVGEAARRALLDPRHHQDRVVRRQGEGHREEEHQAGDLDGQRAGIASTECATWCWKTITSSPSTAESVSAGDQQRERDQLGPGSGRRGSGR